MAQKGYASCSHSPSFNFTLSLFFSLSLSARRSDSKVFKYAYIRSPTLPLSTRCYSRRLLAGVKAFTQFTKHL